MTTNSNRRVPNVKPPAGTALLQSIFNGRRNKYSDITSTSSNSLREL